MQFESSTLLISIIIAILTLLWYAGEFFFFKNYVKINAIIRNFDENLEVEIQNNGYRSVRFDEFGVFILGTPIPMKNITYKGHEISPLSPFIISLDSNRIKNIIDEVLNIANEKYKQRLREQCNEFRFYIKTANKLRLTRIWFLKDDIFPNTGPGLLDTTVPTFNIKIEYNPFSERAIAFYLLTCGFAMWFLIFTLTIDLNIDPILFLTILMLPVSLITPIAYNKTKRGIWAKRHTRISRTLLFIIMMCIVVVCYITLDLSTNIELTSICAFAIILYSLSFMTINYTKSISLKDSIKKCNVKKYDFDKVTNDNEESDDEAYL